MTSRAEKLLETLVAHFVGPVPTSQTRDKFGVSRVLEVSVNDAALAPGGDGLDLGLSGISLTLSAVSAPAIFKVVLTSHVATDERQWEPLQAGKRVVLPRGQSFSSARVRLLDNGYIPAPGEVARFIIAQHRSDGVQ